MVIRFDTVCGEDSNNQCLGMELTLYREGSRIDTYILDMKANGGITGSKLTNPIDEEMEPEEQMIKKEDFKVSREKRLEIER